MRFKYKHNIGTPVYKTTVWFNTLGPKTWHFTHNRLHEYIIFLNKMNFNSTPPRVTYELVDSPYGEVIHG